MNANKSQYPAHKKMHGILTSVMEELPEPPLFISVHTLSQILKCQPPSTTLFRSALHNAGYRVSSCHASPLGNDPSLSTESTISLRPCCRKAASYAHCS